MRTLRTVIALSMLGTMPSLSQAQIPTTDAASIAARGAEHLKTLEQWRSQYEQMTTQITQLQQQFEALTGSRSLGEIMQNPIVYRYLPKEWQDVYWQIQSGGYGGLTGTAAEIYDKARVFDACATLPTDDERLSCEARAVKPSQDQGYALDAYALAEERLEQIDGLMQTINTTVDPKGIAELQARIAIEQTNIANESTKLQLYQIAATAQSRIDDQRQREIDARTWSSPKTTDVAPIAFESVD